MATRRNRIKGIANIPQRRKNDNNAKPVENLVTTDTVENSTLETDIKQTEDLQLTKEENKGSLESFTEIVDIKPTLVECPLNKNTSPTDIVSASDTNSTTSHKPCNGLQIISDITIPKCDPPIENRIPVNLPDSAKVPKLTQRRTFIKPAVNVKLLTQKLKPKLDNEIETVASNSKKEDEILCAPETNLKALLSPNPHNPISDNENTSEPLSPTKLLNRSRIKAVPRLHKRRISATIHGSASESEDDTRKSYKRVKTDSMCSTASSNCEPPPKTDWDLPQRNKDFSTVIQRKCRRTEQSNKMAEARRNFLSKFRNKTPDKQNLTMLDLIFYNPSTKPMTQKQEKLENQLIEERSHSSENCDSPEKNDESEDDNIIPAPQIKIGDNGEIIIDEQSLVVENKQVKKDRENLQKSDLVDGDFDTGYGIYKKVKRAKDWSKEETLFFYKALNTLGTDFSLMVQLFPGRTRKQLKLKFKKEERINHVLIDKALTRPLEFNIKELKEELENKKRIKEVQESQKAEVRTKVKSDVIPYTYRGIKKIRKPTNKRKYHKHNNIYSKLKKGIASVWESSNSEDELSNDSLPESSLSNILKPTRYGRVPKQKCDFNLGNSRMVNSEEQATEQSKELEPGSLMIVCCHSPTGTPTFKVFMVTPAQTKVPVDLPHDVVDSLAKNLEGKEENDTIVENNYTICHDELINEQPQSINIESNDKEANS